MQIKRLKKWSRKESREAWVNFVEDLAADTRSAVRMFYKNVEGVRRQNEEYYPTEIINNKSGYPMIKAVAILERWSEYFYALLNPTGEQGNASVEEDNIVD